ncbi:hypothetical protein [Raineyella antarctica]|uniref:hypothetical protein n=1 Tax=Raineyella antarctica TaxID=1577474 RepID=UPI001114FA9D|nr:hypothetical protein [Raineyella antarctica]
MIVLSPSDRVLAVLPDLIDELSSHASSSTTRQREWAITGALDHYTQGAGVKAMARVTVADLLSPAAVQDYLAAATEGRLRRRAGGPERIIPESPRTVRARASALRWLATRTQQPAPPAVHDPTPLIELTPHLAEHTVLTVRALRHQDNDMMSRAAAAIALVAAAGLTSEQLVSLRTDDLRSTGTGAWIRTDPPQHLPAAWQEDPEDGEVYAPLPPWGWGAVRVWMGLRRRLVSALEGADHRALFVTCAPNGRNVPPGMPLHARGLVRAHQRAIGTLATLEPEIDAPQRLSTVRRLAWAYWITPTPGPAPR